VRAGIRGERGWSDGERLTVGHTLARGMEAGPREEWVWRASVERGRGGSGPVSGGVAALHAPATGGRGFQPVRKRTRVAGAARAARCGTGNGRTHAVRKAGRMRME